MSGEGKSIGIFEGTRPYQQDIIRNSLLPPPPVFTDEELANFGDWVKFSGMRPEGARDFDLDRYPYQKELYDEQRDNLRQRVVIMKAAQTGLTVKLLNRSCGWRLTPASKSTSAWAFPPSGPWNSSPPRASGRSCITSSKMIQLLRGVVQVGVAQIGISNMRFLGLRSGVSNDSNPLDAVFIDEVRLIPQYHGGALLSSASRNPPSVNCPRRHARAGRTQQHGRVSQSGHSQILPRIHPGLVGGQCPNVKCFKHVPASSCRASLRRIRGGSWAAGRRAATTSSARAAARIWTDAAVKTGFYVHENPGAQFTGYQFSQLIKGERLPQHRHHARLEPRH